MSNEQITENSERESDLWCWQARMCAALRETDYVDDLSAPGPVDAEVAAALNHPVIAKVAQDAPRKRLAAYLGEYGCWDETELQDHEENLARAVWCLACDMKEGGR